MRNEMLQDLLKGLKSEGIVNVFLVSRTGMFIAGDEPERSNVDTFSAMAAIVLGASETATSELRESVDHILINLKNSNLVIMGVGKRGVLVVRTKKEADQNKLIEMIKEKSKKLSDYV